MSLAARDVSERPCRLTIFFDGSCPLCAAEMAIYSRAATNEALEFVDICAPSARLPAQLDPHAARSRFYVLTGSGDLLSGAVAFVEVWRHLPRWRHLARIVSFPVILSMLEFGYRVFLRGRPLVVRVFVLTRRRSPAI